MLQQKKFLQSKFSNLCHVSGFTVTAVFTAVAAENADETAVSNTAATSVKFSSNRSKMSFSVPICICKLNF